MSESPSKPKQHALNVVHASKREHFRMTVVSATEADEIAFMAATGAKHPGKLPASTKRFGLYSRNLPIATTLVARPAFSFVPASSTGSSEITLHVVTDADAKTAIRKVETNQYGGGVVGIVVDNRKKKGQPVVTQALVNACDERGILVAEINMLADHKAFEAFVHVLIFRARCERQKELERELTSSASLGVKRRPLVRLTPLQLGVLAFVVATTTAAFKLFL
jgi:hypothetical protein